MSQVTVKLTDPTKIYWEDETVITGTTEAKIERTQYVEQALRDGRLVEVSQKPAPQEPETKNAK